MEKEKMGFFSRVKIAVVKLENYGMFLEEKTSIAVKYFFLIVLILCSVMAAVQTYDMVRMMKKGYEFVKNELPDFSYEEGNLTFPETIYAYDEDYNFSMIIDTQNEIPDTTLQEYKTKLKTTGLLFLKNKVIYRSGNTELEYHYRDFAASSGITSLNKETLLQEVENVGVVGTTITIFLVMLVSLYIIHTISIFMDWLAISVFAFIASRICGIRMAFKHCFIISIYALTLSIFFNMFYNIAYFLAGFYTEYFRLVYLLIAYVYIVAVILMIKSDLLKQQVEVAKIVEVQKEVKEEFNPPEDKDKEEKKEKQKPKDKESTDENGSTTDDEPSGSEI